MGVSSILLALDRQFRDIRVGFVAECCDVCAHPRAHTLTFHQEQSTVLSHPICRWRNCGATATCVACGTCKRVAETTYRAVSASPDEPIEQLVDSTNPRLRVVVAAATTGALIDRAGTPSQIEQHLAYRLEELSAPGRRRVFDPSEAVVVTIVSVFIGIVAMGAFAPPHRGRYTDVFAGLDPVLGLIVTGAAFGVAYLIGSAHRRRSVSREFYATCKRIGASRDQADRAILESRGRGVWLATRIRV